MAMDENFEDADRDHVDRIFDGIEEAIKTNPKFFEEEKQEKVEPPKTGGACAPTEPHSIRCDYCGGRAERVGGAVIYPHRPDLYHKEFIICHPCGAYVGCHASNGQPFGRLANAELRHAKREAHAAFDPIWKTGELSRVSAYAWLSEALGIPRSECHIGMMDLEGCAAVVVACAKRKAMDGGQTAMEAQQAAEADADAWHSQFE